MNEIELVKKSKKGNGDAFSILIKACERDMYRIAISMVKNNDDALDCIQDAILKAYEKILKLEDERYFKTWLIKILINMCNDLLSRKSRVIVLPEVNENATYKDDTNSLEIKEVLEKLDDELRIIVVLYYFEDISVKDIADNLGIPVGTVKSRLSRARNKIKILMNQDNKEMMQGE